MRRRIVGSIVGVAAIAVVLVGVPLGFAVERLYANQEVLRLERSASDTLRSIDTSTFGDGDPVELPPSGTTRFAVYDRTGERIAGAGPARADKPVNRALAGSVDDTRESGLIVVAVPVDGSERVVGALRASRSEAVVVNRTRRTWGVMALIAAAALLIAALLARVQARRLTRPLDELASAATRLGSGDFTVRSARSGIDELDRASSALDTTAARLGGLVARERAFSADASHQLRTPIAGLRVHVESSLITPDTDLRDALAGTLEPIDRLETTVEDLLRLARDTHVDRSPLDVARLVLDTERHWHGIYAARGRPLRVVLDPDLASPAVSEPAIRQILGALLSNAERHGSGIVTVTARNRPGAVTIEVADEGEGVAEPRGIFDRRSASGHGIGLALRAYPCRGRGRQAPARASRTRAALHAPASRVRVVTAYVDLPVRPPTSRA